MASAKDILFNFHLLDLFFEFPNWALSWVRKVFPLAICAYGPCDILLSWSCWRQCAHVSLPRMVFFPSPKLCHLKHRKGFRHIQASRFDWLRKWGRVKVRIKEFVIPSDTPSKSVDFTHFDVLRETCGETWIDTVHRIFELRFLEWFSVAHSTKRKPNVNFFMLFGLPTKLSSPF